MIIDDLPELNPGLEYICGKAGRVNEIRYADIIEIPEGLHSVIEGDFVLTTGHFLQDDPTLLSKAVGRLIGSKCAGLGVKLGKYIKSIDPQIIQLAEKNGFPILSIDPEVSFRDIQYAVIARLSRKEQDPCNSVISDRQSLYASLISKNPPSGFFIQSMARRFGIRTDTPRYVMVAPAESIMTQITYDFPNMTLIYQTQDGNCACIWDCQEEDYLHETKKAASAFLSVCWFKTPAIGVSDVCLKAEHLRKAYMNALFAMESGHITDPKVKVHNYMDYYMHRLIRDNLDHPALADATGTYTQPLIAYDQETGLGLFNTLWALCRANFNMQRACQELNIHRNTLYVRMEKIKSLTKLDIDSYTSRQSAHMAVLYELIEGRYK